MLGAVLSAGCGASAGCRVRKCRGAYALRRAHGAIEFACLSRPRDSLPAGPYSPARLVRLPSRSSRKRAKAGAKGGSRTPTAFRPLDPKSSASASSATLARGHTDGSTGNWHQQVQQRPQFGHDPQGRFGLRAQLLAGRGALLGRRRGRLRHPLHLIHGLGHLPDAVGLLAAVCNQKKVSELRQTRSGINELQIADCRLHDYGLRGLRFVSRNSVTGPRDDPRELMARRAGMRNTRRPAAAVRGSSS